MKDPRNVAPAMTASETGWTALGELTAAGAETPPKLRPKSSSDLDPSVCGVVCPSPMASLVVAPIFLSL